MERSVNVNAIEDTESEPLPLDDALPAEALAVSPTAGNPGPCLYLGPAGQRCDRPAVEGSFCSRHQPSPSGSPSSKGISRRAIAAGGIIAVLWPVLADLVREIIRLLR